MRHLTKGAAFVAAATPGLAWAQDVRPYYGMHYEWGWGHMMFGGLMMVIFWGAVILLVALMVHWLGKRGNDAPSRSNARHILDERFAKGEIDKDEYEERKRVLSS